jgi:DUF971 family protein
VPTSPARLPDTVAGVLDGLPASWLRASCPCHQCRDPNSGQRLVSVTDLPEQVTIAGVAGRGDDVRVSFGPA